MALLRLDQRYRWQPCRGEEARYPGKEAYSIEPRMGFWVVYRVKFTKDGRSRKWLAVKRTEKSAEMVVAELVESNSKKSAEWIRKHFGR